MDISTICNETRVSAKSLSFKIEVPNDVLHWHIEKAISKKQLSSEDAVKKGRGYYLNLAAVMWAFDELSINDYHLMASIAKELCPVADSTDQLKDLRYNLEKALETVNSIIPEKEKPEKVTPVVVQSAELPFNPEQQAYWDEISSVLSQIKRETGHPARTILKATYAEVTKKYGIVWDQLKREVLRDNNLSSGWGIDGRGMTNLQAICYAPDQDKSIFKSVLFDYPKWSAKTA